MASEPTLSTLAHLASTFSMTADSDPSSSSDGAQKTKEQVRRHYVRTLHKVIDQSDIVILVLDARDPEGCRSRIVEEEVRRRESEGKKLVFVLNKIGKCAAWLVGFPRLTSSRSRPARECFIMASSPTPLHANTPVPLCIQQPTDAPVINYGTRAP